MSSLRTIEFTSTQLHFIDRRSLIAWNPCEFNVTLSGIPVKFNVIEKDPNELLRPFISIQCNLKEISLDSMLFNRILEPNNIKRNLCEIHAVLSGIPMN